MVSDDMHAIQVFSPGGPEALELVRLPLPEPGQGELRVRAQAIGVGRPDVLLRRGTYKWMPALPAIPGSEMVGIVDAVGAGVSPNRVGQRLLVSARELPQRTGCYAQSICVPEDAGFALPDAISPVDGVSLPNFQLAHALLDCAGLPDATSILVLGAAGAVGACLTQVARSRGIRVIGTASTTAKRAFAEANGVATLVDADPSRLVAEVFAATQGRGVDIAFDHLGGASLLGCLQALAPMGTVVSYNAIQGLPSNDVFGLMRTLLGRSPGLRVFSMHTLDERPAQRRALMQRAIDDMAAGRVQAPQAMRFALADAAQAHRLLESRSTLGKIVLEP